MKNNEVVTSQGGLVTFYGNEIDVKPGVKTVKIIKNLMMYDTNKCFPDVVELNIVKNVNTIEIPNSLFPNVKNVISKSPYFVSNVPYLIHSNGTFFRHDILLNTFFHKADEVIHLAEPKKFCIAEIADYAFAECESMHLEGEGSVMKCGKLGFAKSAFEKQPFVNGVKMADSILVDVDKDADVIILPDEEKKITYFCVDVSGVKHMISHNDTFSRNLIRTFPQKLTLDADDYSMYPEDVRELMQRRVYGSYIHEFCITERTQKALGVRMENGLLYTDNMEELIAGSVNPGDVVIPEGVKEITGFSLERTAIRSIAIPDSVKKINGYAMSNCDKLASASLGNGVEKIGEYAFFSCESLKSITMPKALEVIAMNAFTYSGLKSVILNDGLQKIGKNVFLDTNIEEIRIPASVTQIEDNAFPDSLKTVYLEKYTPSILLDLMCEGNDAMLLIQTKEKEIMIPKQVCYTNKNILFQKLKEYFETPAAERFSVYGYARTEKTRRKLAWYEYDTFQDKNAKEYLRRHVKSILKEAEAKLDDEMVVRLLKAGMMSEKEKSSFLNSDAADRMPIAKAYVLKETKKETERFQI